ncbi:MAG: hypothetical protein BAA01_08115 [Bacillus thermozeamaize]|uniref:UPF0102 protein BAA01_08115 n=1 Tax=Bacillus thermozeamaize TaxID=230954 RepID=A0A1Y3PT60_9BACI|nr:MAG: hypothetical protein BAA01_08115 [Bacillus thermozeamaize]
MKSVTRKTSGRQQTGKDGEELARRYLLEQGYAIRDVNWRGRRGELDVVAERDGMLIIVEVRTRRTHGFGTAREAVDRRKLLQVRRVAEEYVARQRLFSMPLRLDVIAIEWQGKKPFLQHLQGVDFA